MRSWRCSALLAVLLIPGAAFSGYAGESSAEASKRADFAKAYESAKPEDRKSALDKLAGCQEPATREVLGKVATSDQDADVRVAALRLLARCTEQADGSLASGVTAILHGEKDHEAKRHMAEVLPKLALKYQPLNELTGFFDTLTYPEQPNNNRNTNRKGGGGAAGGGSASNETIKKERTYYKDILAVINELGSQHFKVNANSRKDVAKWWSDHAADFQKADAETLQKLKPDAQKDPSVAHKDSSSAKQ
jgi:hypothetical protein